MVEGSYGNVKAKGSTNEILILLGAVVVFILLLPKILAYLVKSSAKEGSELIQDFPLPEFGITEWTSRQTAKIGSVIKVPELGISEGVAEIGEWNIPELGVSEKVAETGEYFNLPEMGVSEFVSDVGEWNIPEYGVSEAIASTGSKLKMPELGISEWFARL